MTARTLFLIRHGESEYNAKRILNGWPETLRYPLTDHGREQIEKVAHDLREAQLDVIFASPILRTQQTAAIIAEATGAPVIIDERLRETDFGVWDGRQVDEFWKRYASPLDRMDTQESEHLEGFHAQEHRLRSFVAERLACDEWQGKRIAVVSHADPLGTLYGILVNQPLEQSVIGWHPKLGECRRLEWQP